ncbi:hypothetical protein J41TS12_05860 [Paenibacillus antibioticophila]|uniref:Uncharacterized protein n=1 Tax=Paenibacillus antibioticophila TaxID=1274374 RepID=A0A920CDN1_9BACL|nr:hypothetical protein [Paenibacillus antibioticophila]GIO35725.1 hypothetical protein J41TS12_05860 [Paenibacillus antibioticophila]
MANRYKPNIFREMNEIYQIIKKRMSDEVYSLDTELNQTKLEGIREMTNYVKSLSWVKSEITKKQFKYYLECGLSAERTAAQLNKVAESTVKKLITPQAVQSSVEYYSRIKLQPIIDAPLNAISQASSIESVELALMNFRRAVQINIPNEYFLPGILEFLPQQKYDPSIRLEECGNELALLGTFTRSYAKLVIKERYNQAKLAHILSLLNSKEGSDAEWEALTRFFGGEFSIIKDSGEFKSIQSQLKSMFMWLVEADLYRN